MDETLDIDAAQEWMDDSNISCGDCGESSFTVLDTMYDSMMEDAFDDVSPHRVKIECKECGHISKNSLVVEVVETIRAE